MSLFRDKGSLEVDRLGVDVVSRVEEADRLRRVLSGVESGFLPKLIGVYGPPGCGKTLVCRRICGEFGERVKDRFRFVYLNVGQVRTIFSCANSLLVAVGGVRRVGRFGLDGVMDEFWDGVRGWEGDVKRFMLVCLDEADRLFLDRRGDPSGFLYRLIRSQDRLEGSGINLSLLMISNSSIWDVWELDARVRSSMSVEEIFFRPYRLKDMKEILRGRCVEAFNLGVVDEGVIGRIAEGAAGRSKDVRRMIDLLRVCGEIAEAQGASKIDVNHFYQACDDADLDHYTTVFKDLPKIGVDLLYALAYLSEFRDVSSPSTSLVYQTCSSMEGTEKVSYRHVASVLKELEVMGLIGGRSISRGSEGRSSELWLKVPVQTILEYMQSDWRDVGGHLQRNLQEWRATKEWEQRRRQRSRRSGI